MNKINYHFDIPYYIFEEIIEYVELSAIGQCKITKWENIRYLLQLAVINNRLTIEQANFIKEKYCRENCFNQNKNKGNL